VTEAEFVREAEQLRRELLAYCYRLSGSAQDAEDLVQEAMLRGWRSFARFRGEASVRTWLYRIATNAFLSSTRKRRHVPSDLGAPVTDVSLDVVLDEETAWVEPLPDTLVSTDADPIRLVVERDQLGLALIASLQRLPPRQRGALLLREALDFSATEIGEALQISVPAVKSLLQRARATLETIEGPFDEPHDPAASALLQTYMRAFETSDIRLLERTLRDDAMLEMTPALTWFSGRETCLPYLASVLGQAGEWSMRATHANGQPAAVAFRHAEPFGVAVLGVREAGIARISVFTEPTVLQRFALVRTVVPPRGGRVGVDPDHVQLLRRSRSKPQPQARRAPGSSPTRHARQSFCSSQDPAPEVRSEPCSGCSKRREAHKDDHRRARPEYRAALVHDVRVPPSGRVFSERVSGDPWDVMRERMFAFPGGWSARLTGQDASSLETGCATEERAVSTWRLLVVGPSWRLTRGRATSRRLEVTLVGFSQT
jgi:RNA polymerase sigma-70 factor, ECF subfamily